MTDKAEGEMIDAENKFIAQVKEKAAIEKKKMALKLVDEFVDEINKGDLDGFDPLTAAKHCAIKATQMQIDVIQTIFSGPEFKNHLTDALRDNLVLLEAGLNDIKKDIEGFDPGGL